MNSWLTSSLIRGSRALALLLLLAAFLSPVSQAQLSGTYTIGSGGTYANFTAAVTALTTSGVNGPVTFNVISGTYTEQITIPAITGSSESNTITFQAQSGNAADATLRFTPTSTNNYVVYMNGADFIRFRKLTVTVQGTGSYGVAFRIAGDANDNVISENIIASIPLGAGNSNPAYAGVIVDNQPVDNLLIDANTFSNGAYAVRFDGVSNSTRASGTRITNNAMNNIAYAGVYLYYQTAPVVDGNTITGPGSRGIDMYYCHDNIQVTKNIITGSGGYGIVLQYSNGGTGFPAQGLIANNFIQAGSNAYGIYLQSVTNEYIYNNSVNVTGGNTHAYYGNANASSNVLQNNIFSNFGGGYALWLNNSSETSDYNDLFTTGNFVARNYNTEIADLASWQSSTGKDANSVSVYPFFTSASNLHTGSGWLNAKGTPVPEVSDDIDGEARNGSAPDIGADEYTPTVQPPLSGAYNIGAGQTFTSFRSAASSLMTRGVSGPVTFNVLNGTYNEHFSLFSIPGANETNTITFQSSTNVTSGVTLVFNATVPESNYVVLLTNADYVKFHKMTLRANNNTGASYSTVFSLRGGVDYLTLDSCNIFGYSAASSNGNYTLVYADGLRGSNATITGNTFNNGGYAIYWDGYTNATPTPGTVITGNTFLSQAYAGIFLRYHDRPLISGNTITGSANRGIEVQYCHNDLQITKNKVTAAGTYGIVVQYSNGGTGFPPQGLVANNFIQSGSNGSGIYLQSVTNQFVYNNSVNITGGNAQGYYGNANGASNVMKNNVFANFGGGYAVWLNSSSETMDYNNLFSIGNFVGRNANNEIADLGLWQASTSKDANSVSVNPGFTSSTNLHSGSHFLDAKGTALPEVTDDIDGDVRDGSAPDIGADEYTTNPLTVPLAGTYTIGAAGDFASFDAAVSALNTRGVSDAVTFNVAPATYQESVTFLPIPGSSSTNSITFQSATGVASSTTLYSVTTAESTYVMLFYGTDNVRFRNMSFRSNTNVGAQYGIVFYLYGNVDDLQIDHCILSGVPASNSSTNYAIVYAGNSFMRDFKFTNNICNDGGYGLYLDGYDQNRLSPRTVISGNTFNNSDYTGIFLRYHDAPELTRNTIINANSRGIELQYCMNGLEATKNKIITDGGSSNGLLLQYCNGTLANPGIIANNFVTCTASSSVGVNISYSNFQRVVYNSVNMTSSSGEALYAVGGSSNSNAYLNNNWVNNGGGYSIYVASPEGVGLSNNNNHFTTGATIAYWVGNRTSLADLQTASSKEGSSRSVAPGYYSSTNLHSISVGLDSAAVPDSLVSDDIDGEPRDAIKPDIGADEYSVVITTSMAIAPSWNMISIPLAVSDNRKTVLFPTAVSSSFDYEPPFGYVTRDSLYPMIGYWVKFSTTQTVNLSGRPILKDSALVRPGWNLIGSIAAPIPRSSVIQNPPSNVNSSYFEYVLGAGYVISDTLKPGKAFWVKTNGLGKLTLDVAAVLPKPLVFVEANQTNALAALNELSFRSASGSDGAQAARLYFGMRGTETVDLDAYALPPAPPAEAADVRFTTDRYVELLSGSSAGEIPIAVQGQGASFQMSWSMREHSALSYVLVERSGAKITREIPLRATGSALISSAKRYAIRIQELPSAFELLQNYPNPFNPTTTVRFALPEASTVTLTIFTMLGQQIVVPLENASMERGAHSVDIDAHAWASGTYLYRLQAVDGAGRIMTATRKMLLLK